ncbi:MAG: toll/interleukin-1 receptor domain-containing protein [Thermodesulfobacteriota bacterium]|nr:toll/interleukin-1 receptor domain-containing protein [Thermodesulfobacteriota bacterium]
MRYDYKKKSQSAEGAIFNIFISYSTEDSDKIKPVLDILSSIQDTKIFFAEKTINPGDNISQIIINNIKNSDVFLVFCSESAIKSNYVQQEIGAAKSNNKIIIPILLDSNKPTGMLEGLNYLNFYDQTKHLTEINRLYNFIVHDVQSKKQRRMLTVLGLLGLGYLLLRSDDG